MSEVRGQVTERTFYPALIDSIRERGGRGVSEISFNSEPDIIFDLLNRKWLRSVKIGEDVTTLKSAFIQYHCHKDESGLHYGMILSLPQSVRTTAPDQDSISKTVASSQVTCLTDTPALKQEYRSVTFPHILAQLYGDIGAKLEQRLEQGYPMQLVIALLQQHVSDLMVTK
jgi:hypothetical protein